MVIFAKLPFSFNGGYLHGSIRNDTQSDTPNNRTTVLTSNNRSLSPNNSIASRSSSIRRYTATPNQVSLVKNFKLVIKYFFLAYFKSPDIEENVRRKNANLFSKLIVGDFEIELMKLFQILRILHRKCENLYQNRNNTMKKFTNINGRHDLVFQVKDILTINFGNS